MWADIADHPNDETALPEDSRSAMDADGIYREVKFHKDDKTGRITRMERAVQVQRTTKKTFKAALRRRANLVKFGAAAGVRMGESERGITMVRPEEVPLEWRDVGEHKEAEPTSAPRRGRGKKGGGGGELASGTAFGRLDVNAIQQNAEKDDEPKQVFQPIRNVEAPPSKRTGYRPPILDRLDKLKQGKGGAGDAEEEVFELRVGPFPFEMERDNLDQIMLAVFTQLGRAPPPRRDGRTPRLPVRSRFITRQGATWALVKFEDKKTAEQCMEKLEGQKYHYQILHAEWAKQRKRRW